MSEGWKKDILTEWMKDEKMKERNINWLDECLKDESMKY